MINIQSRHSVAELPRILEGITSITLPNGEKLTVNSPWKGYAEIKSATVVNGKCAGVRWLFCNGNLHLGHAYLSDLPSWIQVAGKEEHWFDAERGFPTMQVMKAMICNALGCYGKGPIQKPSATNDVNGLWSKT